MHPGEGRYTLRMMKGLTARQRQILEIIRAHRRRYGRSPSLREIARALGLKSHTTVYRHLQRIQKKGYLEWSHQGRRRALPVDACTDCLRIPVLTLQTLPPYPAGPPVRYVELPRWLLPDARDTRLFALPAPALGLGEGLLVLEQDPTRLRDRDRLLCYLPERGVALLSVRQEGTRLFLLDPDTRGRLPLDRPDARPLILGRVVATLLQGFPE